MSAAVDLATRPGRRAAGFPADGLATGAALAAVLAVATWLALGTVLNHDSAWYLVATRKMLDGGRLYQDIIEVNPPLAFYLTTPPVWLAGVTGLSAIDLFFVWVHGLTGLATLLAAAALRRAPRLSDGLRRALLAAALLSLLLVTWRQIGQREHLLMIFVMPYLFLAGARAAGGSCGWRLGVAVGAFAAFGFGLKPYFLLVPAAIELYLITRERRAVALFRPETVALGAMLASYAAIVVIFTPEYLTKVLPLAVEVYFAYSSKLIAVFWRGESLLLAGVLCARLVCRDTNGSPLKTIADIYTIAAVAFYVAYLIQMKGWTYQRFPVATAVLVVICILIVEATCRRPLGHWRARLLVLTTLAGGAVAWLASAGSYSNEFLRATLPIVRTHAPGGPIVVFTTNVSHGFPLVNYAGAQWSSPFSTLWTIPGLIRRREGQAGDAPPDHEDRRLRMIESFTRSAIFDALDREPPVLIFVDTRSNKPYFAGLPFNYLAFLSTDPGFASFWSSYEQITAVGDYKVFRRQ